jgi:hypothetical protein
VCRQSGGGRGGACIRVRAPRVGAPLPRERCFAGFALPRVAGVALDRKPGAVQLGPRRKLLHVAPRRREFGRRNFLKRSAGYYHQEVRWVQQRQVGRRGRLKLAPHKSGNCSRHLRANFKKKCNSSSHRAT